MTWLTTFYLRAFVVLLQIALVNSDENGPFPGFKQQPVDTIIQSSTNQSILCQAKGEHPLKVSWRKNEVELDIKNSNYLLISREGSLHIFHTQKDRDQGYYRCVVENKYGRIISRRAHASFPYMNAFTAGRPHVTVNEGDQVFLTCHAPDSYPDRNIHWFKMNKRSYTPLQIEGDSHVTTSESGDLYFSYTKDSDKGRYVCSVENNVIKRVLKRTVSLRIEKTDTQSNIPPGVWLFEDKIAMKDSNFMLECIAYGKPVPSMKFRNCRTRQILKGAEQIGNRLRYEFGRFYVQGNAEYSCELENTFGQTSKKTAYIKMEAKPEMLKKSEDISVSVDSTVRIPCVAYGIPSVSYTWFFNGKIETGNSELEIINGNITIPKVMKHHEGFYQCIAKNRHGEALMTVHLRVVEMIPNFGAQSIPPAERTHAIKGGRAEIFCVPGGAPKPSVTWVKSNNRNYILENSERFIILPSGTLTIVNIKKSDGGRYNCIASNKLGTRSKGGELLVTGELAITHALTDRDTIKTGQKMILTCIISSSDDTEVIFTWKRFNHVLKNNSRTKIYRVGPKISKFVIENAENGDTGLYKCHVRGTKDSDKRRQYIVVSDSELDLTRPPGIKTTAEAYKEPTELIVKGIPYPPHDITATEQEDTNIKVSWTLGRDNGSPVRKVYIEAMNSYDTSKWVILKTSNKTTSTTHRHSEIVTLSPWAEYKMRVIAQNSVGLSKPSDETPWIRTPPSEPEKYPKNIKGVGIAPNKIKVTFERLQKIDQNGPGITYYIYYKGVGMSYEWIQETVPQNQNFIILTFRKTDSYYKLYEFKMQAKNDVGVGPMSHAHTAHTGERTPVDVPQHLRIELKPPSAYVEASWQEVSKSRQALRGQFLGYKFLYWMKPKPGEMIVEQFETTHSPYITVELRPFTEYFFAVLVFNNAGDGPMSNEVGPLRTPEGIPSKPANLRLSEASAGEAKLTWDEPLQKNGHLLQYILSYFAKPDGRLHQQELDINVREVQVAGLSPKKEYVFRLTAVTTAGVGNIAAISFNFSKVPSVKPDPLAIISRDQTTIILRWSPVKETNIDGYKLFYWHSDGDAIVRFEKKDETIASIHYLKPGQTYFFQIAVYNKYGRGPKSEITKAETMPRPTPPEKTIRTEAKEVVPIKQGKTPTKSKQANASSKIRLNNTLLIVILLIAVLVPR